MKVFLSYRREDSQAIVDRVAERLRRKLGPGNVFKDVDSVSVGENFLDKIQTALTAADILFVVIGPGWLNASKRPGKRRLDDPDDWVRIEVHEALQRDDVRVVPLLVEGATMPSERDLPPGLKALAYRNACILCPDPLLEADLDTLCERLDPEPEAKSEASALRAVDIPQVTAAGGGIQQAHAAGSPGLWRPAASVLAVAGLATLAIALVIASRGNIAPPTPPEQTNTPKIPTKPVSDSGTTVPSPSQESPAPDAGGPGEPRLTASPTPPEQTGTPKTPAKPVSDSGTTVPSPSRERPALDTGGSGKPRLFVLAFGSNTYPRDRERAQRPLKFAEDDVQSVCNSFRHQSGPLYRSVECRPLLGKAATRRAVLDGFRWLRSSARDGDLCVIHFGGYEIYEERGSFSRFFLMTADSDSENPEETALSRESIADAVTEIPGRVLFLLDTCHSEAAAKPITTQSPRAAVFAACRENEGANESQEAQGGYFTSVVATGLAGRADQDRDGSVTLDELEHYVTLRVAQIAKDQQHPVLVKPDDFPSLTLTQPNG